MPLNRALVGRAYPSAEVYEVAREKIRDFALAIGDPDPVFLDPAAARAAGHPDVLAPPTFLTVLGFRFAAAGPVADPELGLDYSRVVHGEQQFALVRPIHAGDRLVATSYLDSVREAGGNELATVRTEVRTEAGEDVATLTATVVSRGTAP